MNDVANPVCLLAIEEKPNSFLPIDLDTIGVDSVHTLCTLMELDAFIFEYSTYYVKNYLKENNIMDEETLEKKLVIIYDNKGKKRKLPVISKEMVENNNLIDIMSFNINDKNFVNMLINKISILNIAVEIKFGLIDALKLADTNCFMSFYELLPYILKRNLYFYIINRVLPKKVIIRERKEVEV